MNFVQTTALLLCLLALAPSLTAIRWLGIKYKLNHEWRKGDCDRHQGFSGKQYSICRRNLPIMKFVREAVERTREECEHQMQTRRWNCSSIHKAPRYLNDLKRGTKEAAFVNALSAAALSFSVTQACSTRQLGSICSCGSNPKLRLRRRGKWRWGGCSDNIAYGTRFSKKFTEAVENHRMKKNNGVEQALMNIHNAQAGREAVRNTMEVHCKCHGATGNCNFKTCFRRLGDFRKVGKFLRKKYDRVIYVKKNKNEKKKRKTDDGKNGGKGKKTIKLRPKGRRNYKTKDLIALVRSPTYCTRMRNRGSYGTKGRICDPNKKRGKGGCNHLCCGKGFRKEVVIKKERCECTLVWCCEVKCKTCVKREVVTRCR